MNRKRLIYSILTGAVLGIFCIAGAFLRSGQNTQALYLFSFWYNRVLMGLLIGVAPGTGNLKTALIRGAAAGAAVSFAFYSSTDFYDFTGFIAGIIYGVIIEAAAYKTGQ